MGNLDWINDEKIENAEGIIVKGTNSFTYKRDYEVRCKTNNRIALVKGYHIWWCSSHFQPLSKCQEDKLKKELKDKYIKRLKRALSPYCCHVTGMHDSRHFEDDPAKVCDIQKREAYDRVCKEFDIEPKAMVNPNGCGWCMMESERK